MVYFLLSDINSYEMPRKGKYVIVQVSRLCTRVGLLQVSLILNACYVNLTKLIA